MEYRASGGRCAVVLQDLKLPMAPKAALGVLEKKGFRMVSVNLIELARGRVGIAKYRRGSQLHDAPQSFSCSSFTKWLYGERGIWLPRRAIQQREYGEPVPLAEVIAGDLIFTSGRIDYFRDDPSDGVGHVGIASGEGTVIHAMNSKRGIVESSISDFVTEYDFRGARRYIPRSTEVITFETPPHRMVETSDDVRWIVLQMLPRK